METECPQQEVFFQDLHNEETVDHIERTPIHGHTSADNADKIGIHKDGKE